MTAANVKTHRILADREDMFSGDRLSPDVGSDSESVNQSVCEGGPVGIVAHRYARPSTPSAGPRSRSTVPDNCKGDADENLNRREKVPRVWKKAPQRGTLTMLLTRVPVVMRSLNIHSRELDLQGFSGCVRQPPPMKTPSNVRCPDV